MFTNTQISKLNIAIKSHLCITGRIYLFIQCMMPAHVYISSKYKQSPGFKTILSKQYVGNVRNFHCQPIILDH